MKTIFRHFLTVIALVFTMISVKAQYVANDPSSLGDGDNPYLGTAYTYTVVRGDAGSTIEWIVYDDAWMTTLTAAAKYTISATNVVNPTITWNIAGTYYLTYKETLNGCDTYRGVVVVAAANSFQIDLVADASTCNIEEGNVLDWDDYDGDVSGEEVVTPLAFTVGMTKEAAFSIDSWQFNGAFTVPAGISASSITASEGTINVTGNTFTLTGLTSANVTITYNASGLVTAGGDVILTASNGAAISGSITTDDNGSGDLDQKITLNPLPGSSNISF
jgi:hypothetical protein